MPAPPIFGDILGEKGSDEVFRQGNTQCLGQTDGDVDAAGEIPVNLDGVEAGQHQEGRAGVLRPLQGGHGHGNPVGHHQLFEVAPEHPLKTEGNLLAVKGMAGSELGGEGIIPGDRSLNQLGEIGDEQSQLGKIPLRGAFAPVHIDDIAHGLEHIEGDAQGQPQGQEGDTPGLGGAVQRLYQAGLAEEKHGKVYPQAGGQPPAVHLLDPGAPRLHGLGGIRILGQFQAMAVSVHNPGGHIGGRHGQRQENQVFHPGAQVEDAPRSQQQNPLPAPRDEIVDDQQCRGEKQKADRCKLHDSKPSRFCYGRQLLFSRLRSIFPLAVWGMVSSRRVELGIMYRGSFLRI